MHYATQKLNELSGVKIFGTAPEKEPVISFALKGMDVKQLEKYLNDEYNTAMRAGKLSAQPLMDNLGVDSLLRVSFCYFNTEEEINLLITAINAFIDQQNLIVAVKMKIKESLSARVIGKLQLP